VFELKRIRRDAVPRALEKADRYRLLNAPELAESICLDVLEVEPENQRALVMLILARTDQFGEEGRNVSVQRCQDLCRKLVDEYERVYYSGVIAERHGVSLLGQKHLEALAYESLREAMDCYEKAEAIRPPGNDDPILRWNTCVRIIARHRLGTRPQDFSRLASE